jgi:2-polyprenyl-6-methoxyphenol hydroxylase-like FAD-dependent oxidoreductase
MSETQVPVVISGAGPNGLMVACELALAGVRPVVLERLPAPSDEPKANGMVGQVVRQLDMRGLYQRFTESDDPRTPRTSGSSVECRCRSSAFQTTLCMR